jgi:hypothetical protein
MWTDGTGLPNARLQGCGRVARPQDISPPKAAGSEVAETDRNQSPCRSTGAACIDLYCYSINSRAATVPPNPTGLPIMSPNRPPDIYDYSPTIV